MTDEEFSINELRDCNIRLRKILTTNHTQQKARKKSVRIKPVFRVELEDEDLLERGENDH